MEKPSQKGEGTQGRKKQQAEIRALVEDEKEARHFNSRATGVGAENSIGGKEHLATSRLRIPASP